MLIIFNLSGLLIGLLGAFAGILVMGATGSISLGMLALTAVWAGLGLAWRNNRTPDGAKRRFPSLFFIPLPFLAIVTGLLGLLLIPADLRNRSRLPDPRQPQFTLAESNLRTASASGDVDLATKIHNALAKGTFAGMIPRQINVHTTASDTGVLVLVKISNLKQFPAPARAAVLQTVSDNVKTSPSLATLPLYIGIKGTLMFGATQTPTQTNLNTSGHEDLLAFFGDLPTEPSETPAPAGNLPPGNP